MLKSSCVSVTVSQSLVTNTPYSSSVFVQQSLFLTFFSEAFSKFQKQKPPRNLLPCNVGKGNAPAHPSSLEPFWLKLWTGLKESVTSQTPCKLSFLALQIVNQNVGFPLTLVVKQKVMGASITAYEVLQERTFPTYGSSTQTFSQDSLKIEMKQMKNLNGKFLNAIK